MYVLKPDKYPLLTANTHVLSQLQHLIQMWRFQELEAIMPKLDGSKGRSRQMENITVVLHLDGTGGVRARAVCELQSLLSVQAQHPAAAAAQPTSTAEC